MEKFGWLKVGLILIVVCIINIVLFLYGNSKTITGKSGFVITQKLYEEFNGTKDVKKKLVKKEELQKRVLDSLLVEIKLYEGQSSTSKNIRYLELQKIYKLKYDEMLYSNKELVEQYNAELWKQLNGYIKEYGVKHKYDFIHGANGTGTLMYANESNDLTDQLILYINKKYSGE